MSEADASAIVPVHNNAAYLAGAIESILAQECRPREIIVVDDGSTDSIPDVLRRFSDRVVSIRQDNLGPAAARNTGIEHATATLIAFLDADDVWLPGALASHLECFAADPATATTWGQSTYIVDASGTPPRDSWHDRPQWALSVGSMVFRRRVFDEVGPFDPTLRIGEDLDLMIRVTEQRIPVLRHAHLVQQIRFHAGSVTRDEQAAERAHFAALKKAFARRRTGTETEGEPKG